jgi:hypothetical protein
MLITDEEYNRNRKLDVSDKIEQRKTGWGQADYVSWVNAQILLKENHPKLSIAFEKNADGSPVFTHNGFAFVQPYLTDGSERTPSIFFPVMNNTFNAIEHPNACEINTACQRATAKAIATFTGLGICCFAGEDIPTQASLDNPPTLQNGRQASKMQGSVDDWRNFPIKFGKYINQTLGEVSIEDPEYIVGYLMGGKFEFKSETFKEACRQATEAIKNGTQDQAPTQESVEELKKNEDTGTGTMGADEEDGDDVPF